MVVIKLLAGLALTCALAIVLAYLGYLIVLWDLAGYWYWWGPVVAGGMCAVVYWQLLKWMCR